MSAEVTTSGGVSVDAVDRSALMHNYADPTVTFVRGEGSTLFDTEGRPYLDFLSGLAVTSLGHAHPVVAEAIATQARTLSHVSNLFGNVVGPEVAVTLDRLIGGGTDRAGGQVFFANSGAEAIECAIKLARRWAGPSRYGVVATRDAFHGRTLAALAATGQFEKQTAFVPMPAGFSHVPFVESRSRRKNAAPLRKTEKCSPDMRLSGIRTLARSSRPPMSSLSSSSQRRSPPPLDAI